MTDSLDHDNDKIIRHVQTDTQTPIETSYDHIDRTNKPDKSIIQSNNERILALQREMAGLMSELDQRSINQSNYLSAAEHKWAKEIEKLESLYQSNKQPCQSINQSISQTNCSSINQSNCSSTDHSSYQSTIHSASHSFDQSMRQSNQHYLNQSTNHHSNRQCCDHSVYHPNQDFSAPSIRQSIRQSIDQSANCSTTPGRCSSVSRLKSTSETITEDLNMGDLIKVLSKAIAQSSKTADQSINQSNNQHTADGSLQQSINQLIQQINCLSDSQSTEKLIIVDDSDNQSINVPSSTAAELDEPPGYDQSTNQPNNQSNNPPSDKSSSQSINLILLAVVGSAAVYTIYRWYRTVKQTKLLR